MTETMCKVGKMNLSRGAMGIMLALLSLSACDDNTSNLGMFPESDGISNSTAVYDLTTRSLKMDSVLASSTINYLGRITDPETGMDIEADFAAQFYTFENYRFPNKAQMVGTDENGKEVRGKIQCDSCEVRLYFDNYYGDAENPMKLEAYELSRDSKRLMEEDTVYYTDVDLSHFLDDDAQVIASRLFTPKDFNVDESTLSGSSYNKNVRLVLPVSLGQRIMEAFYSNPASFENSYRFIRDVFSGLYFRTSGGKGTMLSVYVGTLNLYYRYLDEEEDTVYTAITRFAATPEVVQSTRFNGGDVTPLVEDQSCTYLKTPAGICTELTLPVDELFSKEHASDSISLASVTLTRYNKEVQDAYQLGTPAELLMVRKADMYRFFLERRVADNRISYTTTFNSIYNTYTFSNIGRLLAYCKHEKMAEAKAAGISEEQWATQHPDWNRVVLIPVVTTSVTADVDGVKTQIQASVTHDLSLNSIRLVGGDTPIKMQVVYSKFAQK